MVDYTRGTGSSGTMMMRDTGSTVEFWLKSGYSTTWFGNANFSYSSPNGSGGFSHGYDSGNTWQRMGAINVSSSGNVSWTMPNTNTSSFGGPTTQTVYINRGSIPGQVTGLKMTFTGHNSLRFSWNRGSLNGGSFQFDQIQVSSSNQSGYGDFGGTVELTTSTGGTSYEVSSGLHLGTTYRIHVRTKNSIGYGQWSTILVITTYPGARIKSNGVWVDAVAYLKINGKWVEAIPFVKVDGVWKDSR